MQRVVIPEFIDESAISESLSDFDVLYDPKLIDDPSRLATEAAAADALIVRNRTQVRGTLLDGAAKLRVVGRLGVGLDNIDLDACCARGIAVYPATGANTDAVAEYVIAGALLLLRGAYGASASVAAGQWPRTSLMGREIAGKTLGLVGFGGIAREAARRAAALGMRIAAFDLLLPPDDPAWQQDYGRVARQTLDELLAGSDVVSLHIPLTDKTRGLLDASAIGRMKRDAILINTSRGGIVDEAALVDALKAGRLGGAALDVFDKEPIDAKGGATFLEVPNLILTPYIAGVTVEANERVSRVTTAAVRRHLLER